MKQEDKWMKKFRERLDDYSEPVPETLWQEIERDLLVDAPKIVPFWKRWQTVAAVALLLVVSSLGLWFWNSPVTQYVEEQSTEVAEETIPLLKELTEEVIPVTETQNEMKPLVALSGKAKENEAVPIVMDEYVAEESVKVDEERADTLEMVEESQKEDTPVENKRIYSPNGITRTVPPVSNKKRRSSWTLGVAGNLVAYTKGNGRADFWAGNANLEQPETIPGHDHGYDGDSEPQDSIADDYAMIGGKDVLRSRGESMPMLDADNYKHHAPVTFGLTVRWNMNDDWALESGLTYTILASDINAGHYKGEQKLHYIGVPLKVNRRIWNNRWLDVYGSAGGMLEKCVYGKQVLGQYYSGGDYEKHQQKLDVDELQASLNASLGVQLKLNKTVGVYAEPGVAYYFDDGSDVETIRKEHPFNFNLQVGVRFTFHK